MIINGHHCLNRLRLWPRRDANQQHFAQAPDIIGESSRHRRCARPPHLRRAISVRESETISARGDKGRHPDYEAATLLSGPCKAYMCLLDRLDSPGLYTEPNGLRRLFLPQARSRSACRSQRARAGPAHVAMPTPVARATHAPRHPRSATPRPPRQRPASSHCERFRTAVWSGTGIA
jgi:hypothetical protein